MKRKKEDCSFIQRGANTTSPNDPISFLTMIVIIVLIHLISDRSNFISSFTRQYCLQRSKASLDNSRPGDLVRWSKFLLRDGAAKGPRKRVFHSFQSHSCVRDQRCSRSPHGPWWRTAVHITYVGIPYNVGKGCTQGNSERRGQWVTAGGQR